MPNKNGSHLMTPSSVVAGSGSASISANGSVSFTSVTSLSLNNVFTSDYDNYMIVLSHTGTTASQVRIQLRSSGTTSATDYTYQSFNVYGSSYDAVRISTAYFSMGPTANGTPAGQTMWIYGPYLAQTTGIRGISTGPWSGAYPGYIIDTAGNHLLSNSYDGFNIMGFSGSLSGRVCVYGLRK